MSTSEPQKDAMSLVDSKSRTVESQLRSSFEQIGYPQLSSVNCFLDGTTMRLAGKLDSFYLKQVAQSVAVNIPGVEAVDNQIDVAAT